MKPIVLVLGAHGMIGRRLVPLLRAEGVVVRAASRTPDANEIRFDWNEPATHAPALSGADTLFLVPQPMVSDPSPGVARLLELAQNQGVKRVVAVTSLGVTFPREPDSSWRKLIERHVEESGLDWTILQPGGFSQNFSESFFLPSILHERAVVTATGEGKVAFVDAADIAAVAAITLLKPGHLKQRYRLTGPKSLSFGEAADLISRETGQAVLHRMVTSEEFRAGLEGAGLPDGYAEIVVRDQETIRDNLGDEVTSTVARITGRAAIPFEDYVRENRSCWLVPVKETVA